MKRRQIIGTLVESEKCYVESLRRLCEASPLDIVTVSQFLAKQQTSGNCYSSRNLLYLSIFCSAEAVGYGDGVDNTVEENSSIFSLIRMHRLPSARACGQ